MSFLFKEKRMNKGFSLLELMVVLAIFAIMTGILIADIPNFRDKSSLDLTVSEMATYIRGAQVYGASQKGSTGTNVSYGVHLEKGKQDFYLFKNDAATLAEGPYRLNGFKINGILVKTSTGNICPNLLDISYASNPYTASVGTALEATFVVDGSLNDNSEYADIQIKGIKNVNSSGCVRVYRNGQITSSGCSNEISSCSSS